MSNNSEKLDDDVWNEPDDRRGNDETDRTNESEHNKSRHKHKHRKKHKQKHHKHKKKSSSKSSSGEVCSAVALTSTKTTTEDTETDNGTKRGKTSPHRRSSGKNEEESKGDEKPAANLWQDFFDAKDATNASAALPAEPKAVDNTAHATSSRQVPPPRPPVRFHPPGAIAVAGPDAEHYDEDYTVTPSVSSNDTPAQITSSRSMEPVTAQLVPHDEEYYESLEHELVQMRRERENAVVAEVISPAEQPVNDEELPPNDNASLGNEGNKCTPRKRNGFAGIGAIVIVAIVVGVVLFVVLGGGSGSGTPSSKNVTLWQTTYNTSIRKRRLNVCSFTHIDRIPVFASQFFSFPFIHLQL